MPEDPCPYCGDDNDRRSERPRHRLRRFKNRLWVCRCGRAWRTREMIYDGSVWVWELWSPHLHLSDPVNTFEGDAE